MISLLKKFRIGNKETASFPAKADKLAVTVLFVIQKAFVESPA